MIEDMELRNLSDNTKAHYLRAVANFARFFGRSPDSLGYEDVRAYHLHLAERGLKPCSIAQILSALRFFYEQTLGRSDALKGIVMPRLDDTLPCVLSREEVAQAAALMPLI